MIESIDRCVFGDDKFQKLVWTTGYRIQMLHHATVLQLEHVVFVVASSHEILYVVLVQFPQSNRNTYEAILDDYAAQHLKPIYNSSLPLPERREECLSQDTFRIEPETVRLNLALWRAMNQAVVDNGGPCPPLVQLLPRLVSWWNASKGMVDVISRYLCHVHVEIGSASPALVLLIWFCFLFGVNTCIATKLLTFGAPALDAAHSPAFGYRAFKHKVANELTLKEVFRNLAKNFRFPMSWQGAEGRHSRTHFSPPDMSERPANVLPYSELEEFKQS